MKPCVCAGWMPVQPRLWVSSCQASFWCVARTKVPCPPLPTHTTHRHPCAASTTTTTVLWSPPWAKAVEPGHIISHNSKEGPNTHGPFFKPWDERHQ